MRGPRGAGVAGRVAAQRDVAKCRAGADYAVTQMFFHVEDYLRLRDRLAAHGCTTPVIPAIMPTAALRQIRRFAELSGAPFPQSLARRLEAARDDRAAGHRIGVEYATAMVTRLLAEGVPGCTTSPSTAPPRPSTSTTTSSERAPDTQTS
jgi:5,10-methylenetetrahydrofolate reductase